MSMVKHSHNQTEVRMSEKQRLGFISSVVAISVSSVTLLTTLGFLPYKAGEIMKRIEQCEEKTSKVDKIAEDVAYIRGYIDSHMVE